jgi:hypothetical protein
MRSPASGAVTAAEPVLIRTRRDAAPCLQTPPVESLIQQTATIPV